MPRWEYKIFTITEETWRSVEERLNQLGGEGWELVTSDFEVERYDGSEEGQLKIYYQAVLKRQRPSP